MVLEIFNRGFDDLKAWFWKSLTVVSQEINYGFVDRKLWFLYSFERFSGGGASGTKCIYLRAKIRGSDSGEFRREPRTACQYRL